MHKESVDPDDAPEFTGDELSRPDVKWRIGGKEVSETEGRSAIRAMLKGKSRINTHVDNDVLAYYKAKAGPRGYQTLINAALRRDMEGDELKTELMKFIEERFAQMTKVLAPQLAQAAEGIQAAQVVQSIQVAQSVQGVVPLIWYGSLGFTEEVKTNLAGPPGSTAITNANSAKPQIFGFNSPTEGTA